MFIIVINGNMTETGAHAVNHKRLKSDAVQNVPDEHNPKGDGGRASASNGT